MAPEHAYWLYPDINPRYLHYFSPVSSEGSAREWPLFECVPKYVTELEPGDVLYNPSWWWHEVVNIGESIAAALRVGATPHNAPKMWSLWAAGALLDSRLRPMILAGIRKVLRAEMQMSDEMAHLAYSPLSRTRK